MKRVTGFAGALATIVLMVVGHGASADVHVGLGFRTLDVTPQSWSELKPEYRFKGKTGDTLAYAEIKDVYVLRCFMHVLNEAHIEKTIEWAIPPDVQFLGGPAPERLLRAKDPALLTVLFTTRKGVVGLMNIYAGMTIVEMNGRYGALLN